MAYCPACLGEGEHDHRADDAWWSEHHSDEQLAWMRERGLVHPVGVVPCDECDATGIVSEERFKDLMAAARAVVDQVMAKVAEEEAHEAR